MSFNNIINIIRCGFVYDVGASDIQLDRYVVKMDLGKNHDHNDNSVEQHFRLTVQKDDIKRSISFNYQGSSN